MARRHAKIVDTQPAAVRAADFDFVAQFDRTFGSANRNEEWAQRALRTYGVQVLERDLRRVLRLLRVAFGCRNAGQAAGLYRHSGLWVARASARSRPMAR